MHPNKKRLRRSMMFLNCQKPGLIKDPYIYKPDSIMLDLEDAVAENQKDAARYSLYHALQEIDYRGVERVVRINGLDTPHWKEDIRVCVAGGADTIRIAKTETAQDVKTVEEHVLAAEKEFGRPEGSTLLMAALESCKGVLNALEVCQSSDRLIGIALSGGDYTKDLQTTITGTGVELMGARQHMIMAARAAGVQCWDTVFTNLDDMEGFENETRMIKMMGFDGKSLVNPRQIAIVHKVFTPSEKEIIFAEKVVREIDDKKAKGIGVFTVDGKMIDIAFYDGAKRTLAMAKAAGVYKGIYKMINAVGREIPEEVLKATGKEPFKGVYAYDNYEYTKAAPTVRTLNDPTRSKLVENIHDALVKCGIKDGMVLSFHHHFREGDYVVNMVMEEVHKMGIKDITICASSLGKAHDPIVPYIEDGTITGIQSSGVRGKIGEAISTGRLKNLAIMRSHGGRVRAIESGEVHIDIAFIGAPTCDEYGNMRANGGKSDCGVLSYAMVDAQYADKVVAVTDCLVPFPNIPASISMVDVDYVCVVDEIGNPAKIATGAAKPTTDVRKIMMADYCTKFVVNTPYFKEGFSYQTGVGGASIASTISLGKIMEERGIHMGLGLGGITTPMCELLAKGLVNKLVDTQDFDQGAIESIKTNPNHFEISASEYANPFNKGAYVNKLDFVILASLEVDVNFNCNVVVGSDGMITGAQGGHPDTAAGAKCTIVIAPLLQGRIPAICTNVTTVTTPGESVDVVITDYGIAINPRRQDLIECMKDVDLPFCTIEELRDKAYAMVGTPDPVQFDDRIVGVIEARDGTIIDVVRKIKDYEFTTDVE